MSLKWARGQVGQTWAQLLSPYPHLMWLSQLCQRDCHQKQSLEEEGLWEGMGQCRARSEC